MLEVHLVHGGYVDADLLIDARAEHGTELGRVIN